jgi:2-polyprenyl-3-methyl-5-hydroxy-6-metoxy-1,4-benzoquinol methylase/ribosomal protein S27E
MMTKMEKPESVFSSMRPKGDYEDVLCARERDGKRFFNDYQSYFVEVSCPACKAVGETVFTKYGFTHKRCEFCKTLYCSPRPTEELLGVYYTEFEAPKKWTRLLLRSDTQRKALQYEPRVNLIVSWMKARHVSSCEGLVVDLGCGSGAFALCLKRNGFFRRVLGLDVSPECVQTTCSMGVDAQIGTIDSLKPNSVQMICINDLIEHLYDPQAFLLSANKALVPGGFLSIATPNGEGFDFKIMGEETRNVTPPEHLNYFNPLSITHLLNHNAFEVAFLETPGKLDVSIIQNERAKGWDLVSRNKYLDFLFSLGDDVLNDFQDFIVRNRLSSHMLVLAQKI